MSNVFESLGLRSQLLLGVQQRGFTQMTPIQAQALPAILEGRDVTGQAQTGSGKTVAFGLGLLQQVEPDLLAAQALVLCPTRELADQVANELRLLARRLSNTRVVSVCGGRPIREQKQALERGAQVVVGTPGRVLDHVGKGSIALTALKVVVLDEADRMLDMGFADQVNEVVAACPQKRQTLLFSATFPEAIDAMVGMLQHDPVRVVTQAAVPADLLQQRVYFGDPGERHDVVAKVLAHHRPESVLIFCETRRSCDQIARFLTGRGASALALHGALEQQERDDVMVQFANGSVRILVATDVAARGLDIAELPAVLVAEPSPDPDSHVHRIGRTGRAGALGLALTLVCGPADQRSLDRIEEAHGVLTRGASLDQGSAVQFLAPINRTVLLRVGRKDKVRKGDVLGALIKEAGLPPEAIGQIDLRPKTTAVAIRRDLADKALKWLQNGRVKKKKSRPILL